MISSRIRCRDRFDGRERGAGAQRHLDDAHAAVLQRRRDRFGVARTLDRDDGDHRPSRKNVGKSHGRCGHRSAPGNHSDSCGR